MKYTFINVILFYQGNVTHSKCCRKWVKLITTYP